MKSNNCPECDTLTCAVNIYGAIDGKRTERGTKYRYCCDCDTFFEVILKRVIDVK